jgi:choice-of-anchor A domain-containing protein
VTKVRLSRLAFALLAAVVGAPALALDLDLGVATDYSGFFLGNASNMPDVEGRLAVGGDLSIHGTSIGGRVPVGSTQPSLVVGGNVAAFDSGSIWAGSQHASFGLYHGAKASKVPSYLDLRVGDLSFDFEAERVYLVTLSDGIAGLAATGTVTQLYSTITLTGSNDPNLEVFNLTASQVKSGMSFALKNIQSGAYLVLNVAADIQRNVQLGITMSVFNGRHAKVLFNFPDTRVLNFTGVQVYGSVLAPGACVCNSSGHIEGTVVADTWDSSMEIGYTPFVPKH